MSSTHATQVQSMGAYCGDTDAVRGPGRLRAGGVGDRRDDAGVVAREVGLDGGVEELGGLHRYLLVGAFFFFQAEDGIRDVAVTGVQTCALPICSTAVRTPALSGGCPGTNSTSRTSNAESSSAAAARRTRGHDT